MSRFGGNPCGDWCYRAGYICDHNQIDGPARKFHCSGIGLKSPCVKGSGYEYWDKASGRDLGPDFLAIQNASPADLEVLGGLDKAARRRPDLFILPDWDDARPAV